MSNSPLKVLHINNIDLPGRRFNGYDLIEDLQSFNIDCTQLVLYKESDNPKVIPLLETNEEFRLQAHLQNTEDARSFKSLIYPWAKKIAEMDIFKEADVVHYHLVHNTILSLYDFPWLTSLKPSVWTHHDPWAFTGHCIYPLDCQGWKTGCRPCPHLDWVFPLRDDTAGDLWDIKHEIFPQIQSQTVLASEYMADLWAQSPLTVGLKKPVIVPFGIDSTDVLPSHSQSATREKLGVPHKNFVLFFRYDNSPFKGAQYIDEVLTLWNPTVPVSIITVGDRMLPEAVSSKHQCLQLGWTNSSKELYELYNACDVFLMPSIAEAFGLMAIEAMASERPVVCFEGTSLPMITYAPECGIAVSMGNAAALIGAIDYLASNPEERVRRGQLGLLLAGEHYSHQRYLGQLASLYHEVANL